MALQQEISQFCEIIVDFVMNHYWERGQQKLIKDYCVGSAKANACPILRKRPKTTIPRFWKKLSLSTPKRKVKQKQPHRPCYWIYYGKRPSGSWMKLSEISLSKKSDDKNMKTRSGRTYGALTDNKETLAHFASSSDLLGYGRSSSSNIQSNKNQSEWRLCNSKGCDKRMSVMMVVTVIALLCFVVVFVQPSTCNANTAFGLILTITGGLLGGLARKKRYLSTQSANDAADIPASSLSETPPNTPHM